MVLGGVLAAVVAVGLVLVFTNGNPQHLFGGADEASMQMPVGAGSEKLAGAQETTDANGIVQGTVASGVAYTVYGRGQNVATGGKVSFAAVGDVMATDMNFAILDAYGAEEADGIYSFDPYYQEIGAAIRSFDISFVNQETPMAGNTDGFEYSGYPSFNTPAASLGAMANVGFDVVNFNSNHTWDMGQEGIQRSHQVFEEYPEIMRVGSYVSEEDRMRVRMVYRGGLHIAFLSYCYGTNTYGDSPVDQPNNYYSCIFDKAAMAAEIKRAQSVADAVVVYMHWGTEEQYAPDSRQLDYAQFLADLDVDLVIGSHAHLCQTVRYYTSASGKQVPVVFGLSDFISGWTLTDTILSGMVTCDFVVGEAGVEVCNLQWHPLIEWSDGHDVYVRMLELMTDGEIQANTRTEDVADDVPYLAGILESLEMECPITWPKGQ